MWVHMEKNTHTNTKIVREVFFYNLPVGKEYTELKDKQMTFKHMKRCSNSSIIRERQMKLYGEVIEIDKSCVPFYPGNLVNIGKRYYAGFS